MSQPSPDAKAVVRAAEALTTQVRRIADTLETPVVEYEVREETTPLPSINAADVQGFCPACGHGVLMLGDGGHVVCTLIDCPDPDAVDKLLTRTDDGPTTPATTCSAQYTGPDNPPTECIRAAHHEHEHPFHTDEKSWNWRDEVAVYPVDSGLVREAPADEDATCRHMETRTCPAIYNGPCGDRPCARFESDDPTPWLDPAEKPYAGATTPEAAPAADEEDAVAPTCWHTEPGSPCDWDRCRQPERLAAGDPGTDPATTPPLGPQLRAADEEGAPNMLRVLADRSARGVLSPGEGDALRRRVEQLIAGRETWKAKAEEIERDRDQHAAAIERVRNYLAELEGAGWSQSAIARRIRAALDGTEQPTEGDDPEALRAKLEEATATLRRVRAVVRSWSRRTLARSEANRLYVEVRDALGGPHPDPEPDDEE